MSFDPERVKAALEARGVGEHVEIGPSVVQESPHGYVYVWPGPDEEGLHIIVSDNLEWDDEPGYLVGVHYEEYYLGDVQLKASLEDAVDLTERLMDSVFESKEYLLARLKDAWVIIRHVRPSSLPPGLSYRLSGLADDILAARALIPR